MRKVMAGLFISLDGVVEAPGQWQFDVFDQDMANGMTGQIAAIDTVLLYHPVVVGRGKHFFRDASEVKRFKLVQSSVTGSGVIVATYEPMLEKSG